MPSRFLTVPHRPRRRLFLLLSLAVFGLLLLGAAAWTGRFLVSEDPLEKADALYVLGGARADRWLEAADLYREGYAPRIILSSGGPDGGEEFLQARGIRIPSEADIARQVLLQIGIPLEVIALTDRPHDNTSEESMSLSRLVEQERWRAVIVVTSKYHTRRTRLEVKRLFPDSPVKIIIRGSRYDRYDADGWWWSRQDQRNTLLEVIKITAYLTGAL